MKKAAAIAVSSLILEFGLFNPAKAALREVVLPVARSLPAPSVGVFVKDQNSQFQQHDRLLFVSFGAAQIKRENEPKPFVIPRLNDDGQKGVQQFQRGVAVEERFSVIKGQALPDLDDFGFAASGIFQGECDVCTKMVFGRVQHFDGADGDFRAVGGDKLFAGDCYAFAQPVALVEQSGELQDSSNDQENSQPDSPFSRRFIEGVFLSYPLGILGGFVAGLAGINQLNNHKRRLGWCLVGGGCCGAVIGSVLFIWGLAG